jgi:hypothetical protein
MTRLSPEDLSTFVRLWDGHRSAVDIWSTGVMLNVATALIAMVWLAMLRSRRDTPEGPSAAQALLLRIAAASSLLSVAMVPLSWIPPDRLPSALLVLMPGRFLNFGALTFVALLIGLLGACRARWSRLVLLFLSCGLLVSNRSMLWEFLEHYHNVRVQIDVRPLPIVWISAAAVLVAALWMTRRHTAVGEARRAVHPSHPLHLAPLSILALAVLMTLYQHADQSGAHFSDRTNDVFFADVAAGSGVLLVAGDLYLVQLRTRRPVLLDTGALDTVMYSLETGAAMQRMLRDIYGLDLFNPPSDAVGAGRIPALSHRKTWEGFSAEEWLAIRREFGVTQVLAYADWTLQLPVASQSRRLLLYDIPDR